MIRFYGASDDLIEVEGPGIGRQVDAEYYADQNGVSLYSLRQAGVVNDLGEMYEHDGDMQEHDHWSDEDYTLTVFDVGGKLTVTAIYQADGVWSFAAAPKITDEHGDYRDSLPSRFPYGIHYVARSTDVRYSTELHINAPEGTKVRRIA